MRRTGHPKPGTAPGGASQASNADPGQFPGKTADDEVSGGRLHRLLADLMPGLEWDPARGLRVAGSQWFPPDAALLALRDVVYARYFCRWTPPTPGQEGPALAPHVSGDAHFVARLTRATGGARYWDHGWQTVAVGESYAFVSDGRIMVFVDDREALWPPDAAAGVHASVLLPCARENLSPGFFYLIGTTGRFERSKPYPRLYLNVTPDAAHDLVSALLEELGRREIAFEAKFANDPAAYCRVDPAVLYLGHHSFVDAIAVLRGLAQRHPAWWREGTPLFALPIAKGIAAAECPPDGEGTIESFGHHRCRLFALGVLEALRHGRSDPEGALSSAENAFKSAGLDLATPHTHHLPIDYWPDVRAT